MECMKSINPTTGALIHSYAEHKAGEIQSILAATQNAWEQWRCVDYEVRATHLVRAAAVLRTHKEDYARLMTLEMGKIIAEARAEIEKCAWVCDFYAENAEGFLKDEIIETDASRSFVSFEPLGIILAVMPWNFPFWQVFRFAAPALMAGNAGILKHASNVSACSLAIEDVFREAGFPEHLFRSLLIPAWEVETVIRDKRVKAVTLTGSEAAGKSVASIAGQELKKSLLELGGSDPFIVLEDADIDRCVRTATQARMINSGQSCIAAKRFIVVQSRLAEFEAAQTEILNRMRIGDPFVSDTEVGPLARLDLRDELHDQVLRTLEAGGRLLTGGNIIGGPGAFYQPTVITGVKKGMPLYHEESFGPVLAIIPVQDEEEAIRVANDSDFGLGGSIWTQDSKRGEVLARRIDSGAVFVNGMTKSDPRLPFGGIKKSGYGRELSHYGIKEFVNIKSIWIA